MRLRPMIPVSVAAFPLAVSVFRHYAGEKDDPAPPDYNETTEWASARLRYRSGCRGRRGSGPADHPKADRQFVQGMGPDHGDARERAQHPCDPEKYASQAWRIGIHYIIYSMSH